MQLSGLALNNNTVLCTMDIPCILGQNPLKFTWFVQDSRYQSMWKTITRLLAKLRTIQAITSIKHLVPAHQETRFTSSRHLQSVRSCCMADYLHSQTTRCRYLINSPERLANYVRSHRAIEGDAKHHIVLLCLDIDIKKIIFPNQYVLSGLFDLRLLLEGIERSSSCSYTIEQKN